MIISRIDGGLGNQMFQYAFGAYVASHANTKLWIDTSSYADKPNHGFLLDKFNIQSPVAGVEQLRELPAKYRNNQAPEGILDRLRLRKLRRVKEAKFGFNPKFLRTSKNSYLVGYWQSEKYFPGMRDQLLREFSLKDSLTEESRRVAEKIETANSVSLHVRRGDYLTNSAAAEIYENLPIEYYRHAVQQIAQRETDLQGFVFSNDIDWCKEKLKLDIPVHYVDHTTADTAYEDMQLMQLASHNVIANSTFSWWSAWLNQNARTIISPAHWFRPGQLDDTNIIPVTWQTLDNRSSLAA